MASENNKGPDSPTNDIEGNHISQDMNKWADFWRQKIGCNVIPADTRNKRTQTEWKSWQDQPIPEVLHEQWKRNNAFKDGLAIIVGRAWHRTDRQDLYLNAIDMDNQKAIDEFCTHNGTRISITDLAQMTLVEQHPSSPNKAHVYVYATRPFRKKSSDNVSVEISQKIDVNEIPAFEVKGAGQHGIMFVSGSLHKNGDPYLILGTTEPAVIDEMEDHIDKICRRYGLSYLQAAESNANGRSDGSENSDGKAHIPIEELFKPKTRILEGHNRHEAVLRVMESLIRRNRMILEQEKIKSLAEEWNKEHCVPPLPQEEIERLWKDATKFIGRKIHGNEGSKGGGNGKGNNEKQQDQNEEERSRSKADVALELVQQRCSEFFVDGFGEPFAVIQADEHKEVVPMASRRFKHWIARVYHDNTGSVLSESEIKNVLNVVQAKAMFGGLESRLELRAATRFKEGTDIPAAIFYDPANKDWHCIKITAEGWQKESCNAMFRRYSTCQAQVEPSKEYPLDIFDQFMALTNIVKSDWVLVKCYILSLFMAEMPKAALMPYGPKGSAKSTTMRMIKAVVDPSSLETLTLPNDKFQLAQILSHNYIAYFDNVSYISDAMSDELCKAITGGGMLKRALYTDDDDVAYSFRRAVGFNGINLAATRSDLLDRGISIQLERISKEKRKPEKTILLEFERIRPQLLGYIFDILVKVLKRWDDVHLNEYPRMADFARFGEIAARCMGYKDNAFLQAYNENIALHTKEAIAASPVASAIIKFMEDKDYYEDTASDLLEKLEPIFISMKWNIKSRPTNPSNLGRRINEASSDLREAGIFIDRPLDAKENVKRVRIRKVEKCDRSARSTAHLTNSEEESKSKESNDLEQD